MIIVMTASQHSMSIFEDKVSALQIHTWLEIKLDTWLIPTRAGVGESYTTNFSLRANFRFRLDSDIHIHTSITG